MIFAESAIAAEIRGINVIICFGKGRIIVILCRKIQFGTARLKYAPHLDTGLLLYIRQFLNIQAVIGTVKTVIILRMLDRFGNRGIGNVTVNDGISTGADVIVCTESICQTEQPKSDTGE